MFRKIVLYMVVLHFLAGCAAPVRKPAARPKIPPAAVKPVPPSPKPAPSAVPQAASPLTRIPDDRVPRFVDDMDLDSLERAIDKSLQYYRRSAGKGPVRMDDDWVSVKDLQDSLIALREILRSNDPEEVRQAKFRDTFDIYQSTGSDGKNSVLFTGYFMSSLKGSLTKTDRYRYPIYRIPDDAIIVNLGKFQDRYKNEQLIGRLKNGELVPYYSRDEIENQGFLDGRGLELVWVDDRIDLFFMHTQGSGRIELVDGRILQVGYAFRNGRPYQSISTYLLKTGKIAPQENSYREIKKYLREHPDEHPEILGYNENFIFFRVVGEGPVGAIEEVLTPGRSIATDPDLFPKGGLAFIRTRKPVMDKEGNVESWTSFSRFVVSQDVGSAIKGPGRVDLFCGGGFDAEMLAGSLKERGELYFLVKKRANSGSDQKNARK